VRAGTPVSLICWVGGCSPPLHLAWWPTRLTCIASSPTGSIVSRIRVLPGLQKGSSTRSYRRPSRSLGIRGLSPGCSPLPSPRLLVPGRCCRKYTSPLQN
jgi:hypothetical protein